MSGCGAPSAAPVPVDDSGHDDGTTEPPPTPRTQCDPVNPQPWCLATNYGCYFSSATETVCLPAGIAKGPGTCTKNPRACAPGYTCVNSADCRRWCVTGSPCPGGTACKLSEVYWSDGRSYGWCVPP